MNEVYFDNASTTYPKPDEMTEFIYKFSKSQMGSFGRTNFMDTQSIINEVRGKLLDICNANKDEYFALLQSSSTEAINTYLRGIDFSTISSVYITPFEHNAVIRTLHDLNQVFKFEINYLLFDDRGNALMKNIKDQFIVNKPDLIITTHISNVIGIVIPIEEIYELSRSYNTHFVVDASQSFGIFDIDCSKSKYDAIIYAGHKTLYGPTGIGGMLLKKTRTLKPLITGGTGNDSANKEMPKLSESRYEAGTMNSLSIAGLYASLEWIEKVGRDSILQNEQETFIELIEILKKYRDINAFVFENQMNVISITHKYLSPDELGKVLLDQGIIVRVGLQCSPDAHKHLKTYPEGTVRLSISYFTSKEELRRLDEVLGELELMI